MELGQGYSMTDLSKKINFEYFMRKRKKERKKFLKWFLGLYYKTFYGRS
jgi:hypothetical protein